MEKFALGTRCLDVVRRGMVASRLDRLWVRWTYGADPRSFSARVMPSHRLFPCPSSRRVCHRGIIYELDPSDYMEWCAYTGIATEPRAKLYSLLRKGQTVLDIGTNVGETLLNFARIVGSEGRVIGFEPYPLTYGKCRRNIELNPELGRVARVYQLGLGSRPGTFQMVAPARFNRGGTRVTYNAELFPSGAATEVQISTVDRVLAEGGLGPVHLMKIDVEGLELDVLRGAEALLRDSRPILFIELGDKNLREIGSSAAELVEFLCSRGYGLRHAQTDEPVRPGDSILAGCHFDIIGTPLAEVPSR